MNVSIMQPYFFPYIGYFQLISASDVFIFYDDVDFIKNGWINRNRILLDGKVVYLTLPLQGASSNKPINKVEIMPGRQRWQRKLLAKFDGAYRKSPHFDVGRGLLESVLDCPSQAVADLAQLSVTLVMKYLGIETELRRSSKVSPVAAASGQDRVIDICKAMGADTYINMQGGAALYDWERFKGAGLELAFLAAGLEEYDQGTAIPFEPGLSILDLICWQSRETVGLQALQTNLI